MRKRDFMSMLLLPVALGALAACGNDEAAGMTGLEEAQALLAQDAGQDGHIGHGAEQHLDRAHLNREFSRLSGRSPTQLASYIAHIEHGAVDV